MKANTNLSYINQFKTFFDVANKSRTSILISVLISYALISLAVNLLFLSALFKKIVENQLYFVLIGLFIYSVWFAILFALYKKDSIKLKDLTVTTQKLTTGLLAGLYVFIGVNLLFLAFSLITYKKVIISEMFSSIDMTLITLSKFTFNTLPGVFIEELVFRGFLIPQVFLLINNKFKNQVLALIITIVITQALFAIAHIPRDLFRNNYDFSTINSNIFYLFRSGIIFSIIFLWTRNIFFISIFHALMNFSLPVINAPSPDSFKFYTIVAAVIITFLWNRIIEPKGRKETLRIE